MAIDHRVTLHKLEVFTLVVELGSVSHAAEQLYVSQPVVTGHIRSLEARVGAQLFYREGRHLRLTEAGLAVHSWARDMLTHTRELSRQLDGLTDGTRGSVVVGASMSAGSYLLPPILARFQRERPLARLQLNITDSEHAVQATEAGETDFAVVTLGDDPGSPSLEGELLGLEQLVLVKGAESELDERPIGPEELSTLPFVESLKGMIRRTLVDRQLEKEGVRDRNVILEVGHPEAMKRIVQEGLGVSLLFRRSVQEELDSGRLRELELRDCSLSVPLYLVRRRVKLFSAIQSDLMEAVREKMRAALSVP